MKMKSQFNECWYSIGTWSSPATRVEAAGRDRDNACNYISIGARYAASEATVKLMYSTIGLSHSSSASIEVRSLSSDTLRNCKLQKKSNWNIRLLRSLRTELNHHN